MMTAKRSYEEAFVSTEKFDVDNYKYDYVHEHQWEEVKRKFMLTHQEKYSEDRLIRLTQIFYSVHFMGRRYDDSVMELIEELSIGVVDKNEKWEEVSPRPWQQQYQSQQPQQYQQYNSGTSRRQDFSSSSYGGNNSGRDEPTNPSKSLPTSSSSKFMNFVKNASREAAASSETSSTQEANAWGGRRRGFIVVKPAPVTTSGRSIEPLMKKFKPQSRAANWKKGVGEQGFQVKNKMLQSVFDSGPFGQLVLIDNPQWNATPKGILRRLRVEYSYIKEPGRVTCITTLKKSFLSSGVSKTKKKAKKEASKIAIERLRETSFTIQVKKPCARGQTFDRSLQKTESSNVPASVDVPIDELNPGKKLRTPIGWSGGGLGKNKQLFEEILSGSAPTVKRSDLGIQNVEDLRQKVCTLLENYVKSDPPEALVFASDFSEEERMMIHSMSLKYLLTPKSFGTVDNPHLVIYRRLSPLEIVDKLLSCGGETDRFKLIPPKSFQNGTDECE